MSAAIDRTSKLEAALAELLRLYDWRFYLARMEAAVKAGNFLLIPEVNRLLRQYGAEKKAAWAVARELLRGGETAIRGSQSSQQLLAGETPAPATDTPVSADLIGATEAEKANYWFDLYLEETTRRRQLERDLDELVHACEDEVDDYPRMEKACERAIKLLPNYKQKPDL